VSVLAWPCPAIFRHKIGRPIGDADLLLAWAHVPSDSVRVHLGGGHTAAERQRVMKLRQRVLDLRAARNER
jgi:hypothetical protein